MSLTQEKALFQLSGKLKLADLSTESLQKMTDLYPYFIPARFFLAAKERASTNKGPLVLAQKANLYFTNPHWLWYQLEHSEKNLHTLSTATTPPLSKKPEVMAVPTVEAVKDILRKIDPAGEQKTDNTKIDFSTETESR
ncbi:MAG: hypothetical protein Q8R50_09070, partial [Sediminibacterium sp.]|nr:hypothetical protein [Sediminibacterium sp.]